MDNGKIEQAHVDRESLFPLHSVQQMFALESQVSSVAIVLGCDLIL
jgi:hypothetical protein